MAESVASESTRKPGALEWLALAVVLTHGTQAACNVLRGPKGAATMYVSAADVLLGLAFIVWIYRRISRRDFSWPPISIPLAAAAWMAVSLGVLLLRTKARQFPVGDPAKSGIKEILQFCEYFVAGYLVFADAFRSERVRRLAVDMLGAAAAVAIAVGLGMLYLKHAPVRNVVGSWFQDRHTFGMFLALALPVVFGRALFACSWQRCVLVALAVLAALSTILAGGPFLALCAGLLVVAGLRGRAAFLITAAVLLLFCTQLLPRLPRDNSSVLLDSVALYKSEDPYGILGDNAARSAASLDAKRAALTRKILERQPVGSYGDVYDETDFAWRWQQRWKEWQPALDMMANNPLVGVGTGAYQKNIGDYYSVSGIPKKGGMNFMEQDAMSFYMVWGASVGVPFLLLFGWMLLSAARNAGRALFSERALFDRGLAAGVIGSLAAFMVGGIFTDPLVRGVGITAALILALALTLTFGQSAPDRE